MDRNPSAVRGPRGPEGGVMTRAGWRTLAVILALFAAGHTLGTTAPHVTHGAAEASVVRAMQDFRFPIMGFERSYWEFYIGFALTIGVQLALMAAVSYTHLTLPTSDLV